ncbi:MAG TPA: FecR domain-containing protein [Bauldia sp.]|nr:FecR domain-containing protein [Bauldia sp.]
MKMRPLRFAALQVLLLFGAAHLQTANAASNIGVTSAAQNEVHGNSQPLTAGSHVFQDEIITTGAKSMAQFLFLDKTSLSVGPMSNITLDKFVYNPSTGAGSVVLNVTQGAFRFVSGSQPSANYKINTAIATIGTRGTTLDGYKTDKGLYLIAQEGKSDGAVIVTVNGKQYVLKPGQALFVSSPDKTVTGPMAPDDEFFDVIGLGGPFPLYGGLLPGEHEQIEVPDDGTVRGDELFQHPEPCDEGGYGMLLGPWEPKSNVKPAAGCDDEGDDDDGCSSTSYHWQPADIRRLPVIKASC